MARFEFVDQNHVNQTRNACGVELCAIDEDTRFGALCKLLYGSSQYLDNIYLSYPSTMETPSLFELYYFNDNLNYDEIAVKVLYGVRRSDNNTGTQDWTIATPSDPISSLPADKTNVTLASIMQRVTEAKSAETDADGNTIMTTNTWQDVTAAKTFSGQLTMADRDADISNPPTSVKYCFINGQDASQNRLGAIGFKLNPDGRYGSYLQGGNEGSLQVLSDGENAYFLLSESPPANSDGENIATTKWVNDKGYLTAIPVASQTVLGGVKVYTDSEGYFCIDTQ